MDLISLVVAIVIAGLIWFLVDLIPLQDPFKTVLRVLLILIFIVYLLGALGGNPTFRIR